MCKLIPVPIPIDSSFQPTFTPYIEICGTVDTVNDLARAFHINAHQYVASLKTSDQSQKFQSLMPVECVIPNTARWKKSTSRKKFIVQPHRYINVSGSIIGRITKKVGDKNTTKRFQVEVDNITFLGCPTVASSSTSPGASSTTPTPTQPKLKFNFSQTNKAAKRTFSEEEIHDDKMPSKHPQMC
ncbi:hypothetical protein EDD22DRAFT_845376 [Suillus occidentalis]|nr:hypothetical protein EDD22DRAFT_845376 [Suillus occidentalis]